MMDQQNVACGRVQIIQSPDLLVQRRVDMLGEDVGGKAKALQHRLYKQHRVGDGIGDRRAGMKLMNVYLVFARHGAARRHTGASWHYSRQSATEFSPLQARLATGSVSVRNLGSPLRPSRRRSAPPQDEVLP